MLSNLANTATGTASFDSSWPVYQSVLGGSSDATIQQLRIALGSVPPGIGSDPFYVQTSLLSDNASAPGSSLGAFNYYGSPLDFSYNTPYFNGNFNVTANTRYWIRVDSIGWNNSGSEVLTTSDSSEAGTAGWSIDDSSLRRYGVTGPSIEMEIIGVQELSALSLLAVGLSGLAIRRRRS